MNKVKKIFLFLYILPVFEDNNSVIKNRRRDCMMSKNDYNESQNHSQNQTSSSQKNQSQNKAGNSSNETSSNKNQKSSES